MSKADTEARCTARGARLCSVDEIDSGTTAGTGCGYDVNYIWTSTWCGFGPEGGKFYVSMGSGSGQRICKNPKKSYPVRCCSDVDFSATTQLPATTTTTFPFLSNRKSCGTLGWEVTGTVCGESDNGFKKGMDKCFTNKNHPDAERKCLNLGGRMCTQADIEAGVGKSTGCGFDAKYVWTSTPCGSSAYIRAKGNGQGDTLCAASKSKGPMRCCSDVVVAREEDAAGQQQQVTLSFSEFSNENQRLVGKESKLKARAYTTVLKPHGKASRKVYPQAVGIMVAALIVGVAINIIIRRKKDSIIDAPETLQLLHNAEAAPTALAAPSKVATSALSK